MAVDSRVDPFSILLNTYHHTFLTVIAILFKDHNVQKWRIRLQTGYVSTSRSENIKSTTQTWLMFYLLEFSATKKQWEGPSQYMPTPIPSH